MRVLILAGGFGTRLASVVKDTPKPMAPVVGRPFLEYQIEYLRNQGFAKFTLLTGYLSEQIESHFGDGSRFGVEISYSVEREPLGTGGAIRQAMESSTAAGENEFLILNGDGLFATDYRRFVELSRDAALSIALKFTDDLSRYGAVDIDEQFRIVSFREKTGLSGEGYINAGAYFVKREALALFPSGKFSIETAVFQPQSVKRVLAGIPCGGKFVDIGTPESFDWAQSHLPGWLKEKFTPCLFLDRDGVLIQHKSYLHKVEDVVIVEEMAKLAATAKAKGWRVVVITNQAGVARGYFEEADCEAVHERIVNLLSERGVKVDDWFTCFTHPDGKVAHYTRESFRRKPKPGMVLQACEKYPIDLARSLMIGDNVSDQLELPDLRTILVRGDFPLDKAKRETMIAETHAQALQQATEFIQR